MDRLTKGFLYLKQAHKALERDFKVAFDDQDWNIAIRRAQESVEYAAKAVFLMCGEDPPKDHVLPLRRLLSKVLPVAFGRGDDLELRGMNFLLERDARAQRLRIWRVDNGVWVLLAEGTVSDISAPLGLRVEGNTIKIIHGDQEVESRVDSYAVIGPGPTREEMKRIARYVANLASLRDPAFYFDRLLSEQDAKDAEQEAWIVLREVLRILGVQVDVRESGRKEHGAEGG